LSRLFLGKLRNNLGQHRRTLRSHRIQSRRILPKGARGVQQNVCAASVVTTVIEVSYSGMKAPAVSTTIIAIGAGRS
jgi:hypothetical protein